MTDYEIYEKVESFISESLGETAFDKGLPLLQDFVWNLGGLVGKTGEEILRIYFDTKSKKKSE